ncbi:LysR substrate-binding domain-containing protein [uncultured Thiodictyon sp.]|uniref:LysR substrate-binding domain-containing protein n=1 Tax=uncultured Thiodictyon sp. TaxID=1846217 RepID=UPI0025E19B1B|nr:LysR substrate-binding domain-containing protein [uncultured Thiodictyon sp.]
MNLRDLKYILAVAETRHFGRAADRCFVSQPTLSGQIKKLEDELGVVIFERTNRSVEITAVGESILTHARLAVEQADAIDQLARAHQDPLAGPLRIGAIPTLSPYLMPLVLVPLKRAYPKLRLVLSEEITESLVGRLHRHEIDAALLATTPEDADLEAQPLFDEPFWLAHPSNHPLYEKDEIEASDLDSIDLLLLADGHCLAAQVMQICHLDERPTRGEMADLRAASLETLLQLVGAGFGCTLVPALTIRGGWMTDSGIIARPLTLLPQAHRRISLVYRRSFPRRAALDAFAQVVRDHLPNTVRRIAAS